MRACVLGVCVKPVPHTHTPLPHRCMVPSTPSIRQRTTPAGTSRRMSKRASSVSVTILIVSTTDLGSWLVRGRGQGVRGGRVGGAGGREGQGTRGGRERGRAFRGRSGARPRGHTPAPPLPPTFNPTTPPCAHTPTPGSAPTTPPCAHTPTPGSAGALLGDAGPVLARKDPIHPPLEHRDLTLLGRATGGGGRGWAG